MSSLLWDQSNVITTGHAMRLESLHCEKCGSTLEVPNEVGLFTCNFCGARLHVRRTEAGVLTELLAEIGRHKEEVDRRAAQLASLREVDRLDRAWDEQRRELVMEGRYVPRTRDSLANIFACAVVGVVCCVCFAFLSEETAALGMFFTIPLLLAGAVHSAFHYFKARRYEAAWAQYQHARNAALGVAAPPARSCPQRRQAKAEGTSHPATVVAEADGAGSLLLSCCNCGSPLETPRSAATVWCGHCGGLLAVRRTRSATFTTRIEAARRQAENLAAQSAQLACELELVRIDAEWARERKALLVDERDIPTRYGYLARTVPLALLGCGLAGWSFFQSEVERGTLVLGVLVLTMAAGTAYVAHRRAFNYERAYAAYLERRSNVKIQPLPDDGAPSERGGSTCTRSG